jgi:deoxyribodipyrimidine photo-lyase
MHGINQKRVRKLNSVEYTGGSVLYWMSREQRVHDNWALLFAQNLALSYNRPLRVAFCIVPQFLGATQRQYHFMLAGLKQVEKKLLDLAIPFHVLLGSPVREIPRMISGKGIGCLVTDFDPLRIKGDWKKGVIEELKIPIYEVDAHNIVPCWIASPKQEYSAYTFRRKVTPLLDEFLTDYPLVQKQKAPLTEKTDNSWERIRASTGVDEVPEVDWIKPGEQQARRLLLSFIREKLSNYEIMRNKPEFDGQSNLSPYLHFGQLSAQRVAWNVTEDADVPSEARSAFLEELIVRRELSDNFCYYNRHYDSFESFPNWAKVSLKEHLGDRRSHLYSLEQFKYAKTHDELWNAAQREMVVSGKMHGYMRMYWAKKILEWAESPEEALRIAIYLNDRYELDGRDPNGYAGIAWSIGGLHDRAWKEREVFGKVRYMSFKGCVNKFNVNRYIENIIKMK